MKRNNLILFYFCIFFFICFNADAQLNKEGVLPKLKQHILILSHDSLKGRETGTREEKIAAEYIREQFKTVGLTSYKTSEDYFHTYTFTKDVKVSPNTSLSAGKKKFKLNDEFYPLAYSDTGSVNGRLFDLGYGISTPDLDHDDYKKKINYIGGIFLIDIASPDGSHPHSKFAEVNDIRQKIDLAIKRGAKGILFHNSDEKLDDPSSLLSSKITASQIPVAFIKNNAKDFLKEGNEVSLNIYFEKNIATGINVAGYLNNNKEHTIILGAHYDHLGMGDHGSMHRGEPAVHNGADDNASGVAGMIELARYFNNSDLKNYNYLFVAFSGEEMGLYGSRNFANDELFDPTVANAMLNFDMIGRLDTTEKILIINGTGSSALWDTLLNSIKVQGIEKIKTTSSGIGPSDHTSFYLKDIPVLHFFSGTHADYHKPSDDEHLINYSGLISILNYVVNLTEELDKRPKLEFSKTKEETESTPRFKVTLGVVPDYTFEGEGMRIDGVSPDKPAEKAGLKAGDIVIQMGDIKVFDMMSYMKGLSAFSKGDKTIVKIKRGEEIIEKEIAF
ncbi:MAG: M20/M25/M40 family metallo-hydrolase [Bacteroidia bacterium]